MKKTIPLILALLLLGCVSAQAASNVIFVGGAEEFVFMPGSVYTDSDLFENFKGVMPGDVITQRIIVKNNSGKEVRIFLRADPVEEKHREFLSRLNLQVSCKDEQIFDAATSETAQLTENTLLGAFKSAGSTELVLTLTVPYDLGNEFMATMGIVPWTFLVEEVIDDDTPHTGDDFELGTWMLAGGMILAAIAWVLIQMKRQKSAQTN
ncbi:MAG: hypothetical protein E7318_03390 [Clostridiales bacterium]|nr:hypothetical protein [Clostridiales bacterium]